MPKTGNLKLTDRKLKILEEAITKTVLSNLDKIIEEKFKVILERSAAAKSSKERTNSEHSKNDEIKKLRKEVEKLRNDLLIAQSDIEALRYKADETIGSLSYISAEHDSFQVKIKQMAAEVKLLTNKDENYENRLYQAEKHLDEVEQYGRRENLEIHGIPMIRNENTNHITKTVAKCLNVELDDSHISTSHRLFHNSNNFSGTSHSSNQQNRKNIRIPSKPPPIIVRFTNRDKRNDLFRRKMLQTNSELDAIFGSASKITFKENLTVNRKMLYDAAVDAKRDLNYKFLWTTQGRIRLRQDSESPVITVSSLFDLRKIGYSGPVRQNRYR